MKSFMVWIILTLTLSLLPGCSRHVTVKIGLGVPMSGEQNNHGMDVVHGAKLAVDELNAEDFRIGGKRARFELVIEDDKANINDGKEAANRLVKAEVSGVFGHLNSSITLAIAPVYAAAGIPQLTPSTHPKYTRMGLKTAFRIGADDIAQSAMIGRLISEKLRAKSVFLVDDRGTVGTSLTEEVAKMLKAKYGDAPRESLDPKTPDYNSLMKRIAGSKADLVFYGGDEAVGLIVLKALRASGSSALFVTGDTMCETQTLKHAMGVANNDYYCTMIGVPLSWMSSGINFTQQYKDQFGGEPGAFAPIAYDSVYIFAQAMQRAGSADPQVFVPFLTKGAFDGKIQGSVEFDSKGDLKDATVVIYQAISGRLDELRSSR